MFSGLAVADEHPRQRWTRLVSFTLQGILVAAALALPLLHPVNFPEAFANRRIFVPLSSGDARVVPSQSRAGASGAVHLSPWVVNRDLSFHRARPQGESTEVVPPGFLIGGGPGSGATHGVLTPPPSDYLQPVLHPVATAKPLHQSVMMEGNLIRRVEPQYPAIARQIRLQGSVIIRAMISREGAIERTEVVSGPSLLAHAAVDAVNQWKYRPYYLNGEPIEVETRITVNFVLQQ